MAFFCKNAQEEALKGIEYQMWVANEFNLIRELHGIGVLSEEKYIEGLKKLAKISTD